jgi:D-alanine-D-alanine ligase
MKKKQVAVLRGGWNKERQVSLDSSLSIIKALEELGHDVVTIDVMRNIEDLVKSLTPRPDVVFNTLHGVGGEDGVIQGLLEVMSIPYTHSGVLASAVAMHKVIAHKIFEADNLLTPPWKVVSLSEIRNADPMLIPYVLKPINEGSSLGVFIIHKPEDRVRFLAEWTFGDRVLVEKYIKGREVQVGVMGDKAIGAIEICPKKGFYDYAAKYTDGLTTHYMPARLSPAAYEKVMDLGLQAHRSLECRSVSRSDFIYEEEEDQFYLLEVNTQPGMTSLSLLPEIAAHYGIPFKQLIAWIVEHARCDH